jgi:hypothetical protein
MTKKIVLRLVQFSILVVIILLIKPNAPVDSDEKLKEKGFIRKSPSIENIEEEKISKIEVLTDGGKVNRLNQSRSLETITADPNSELLGEKGAFEPLLILNAAGPLNIKITGQKSFDPIEFHIPKTKTAKNTKNTIDKTSNNNGFIIEIFPKFRKEFFNRHMNEPHDDRETIKIYAQGTRGPYKHVASYEIAWSGPKDLFLSHENLIDLAALTGPKSHKMPTHPPAEWLAKISEKIQRKNLRYETELEYAESPNKEGVNNSKNSNGNYKGWQKVRSLEDMQRAGAANCIDLCTWIGQQALSEGYKAYIIADSNHAFCAISMPEDEFSKAIAFETTNYLRPPLKPPDKPGDPPREYRADEEIIYPERPPPRSEEKKELFVIDLDYWSKFFLKK